MILAVVGPTASGKSDFALDLAERYAQHLGKAAPDVVEVVGADAMQLYRGMDVGTAKLPTDQRRGIVHHQLDVLDIRDEAAVASYQSHARKDIDDIQSRGKLPLVVGGSGLYVRALLDDMTFPPTDARVRERLEVRLEEEGPESLHEELSQVDPQAAECINRRNGRRIVRALEVIEVTGRPFSATLPKREYVQPTVQIGITRPIEELEERIGRRTRLMFDDGLVDEVTRLKERGLAETKTAARATGYSQVLAMLAGEMTKQEAMDSISLATVQLAKRQIKWFRADPRIAWVDGAGASSLQIALDLVATHAL